MQVRDGMAYLTATEMSEVDRSTTNDFGVDVLSLMENAGVAVASLARRVLGGDVTRKKIVCLIGKGNNGGDGLVAARHLHDWGAGVEVMLSCPEDELKDIPAKQFRAVKSQGIRVSSHKAAHLSGSLVVDALLGYSSKGAPHGTTRDLVHLSLASDIPVLAVDIPSGLDATTGFAEDPCITAQATITLGFPKTCFLNPTAAKFVGELYLADISLPRQEYTHRASNPVRFDERGLVSIQPLGSAAKPFQRGEASGERE